MHNKIDIERMDEWMELTQFRWLSNKIEHEAFHFKNYEIYKKYDDKSMY